MRAAPALVAALLIASVGATLGPATSPAAGERVSATETPLFVSLTINVTDAPPKSTIMLRVDSFLWGEPVDLDELTLTHQSTGLLVANARVATGVYEAGFVMPSIPAGAFGGGVYFRANATVGGTSVWANAAVSSSRSSLTLHRLDEGDRDDWGSGAFNPGDTVHFEVFETDLGRPADLGTPNITVQVKDGHARLKADPLSGPLTPTRVGVGTYRFDLAIPADLVATREYSVRATLEPALEGPASWSSLSDSSTARVRHTPVTSYLTNVSNESADITVLVGDADPIAGARVLVSASAFTPGVGPDPTVTLLDETTGPWGTVRGHLEFPTNRTYSLRLDVVEGDFTSTWTVGVPRPWPPPRTADDPGPPATGFAAFTTLMDPPAADVMRVRVQVFQDGAPLANTSVAQITYREYVHPRAPIMHGNVTTDADGAFVVDFSPPAVWGYVGAVVYLWNDTGARTVTRYDGRWPVPDSPFLPVAAGGGAVGEPLRISANVSWLAPPATGETLAWATVIPAASLLDAARFPNNQDTFTRYGGRPPSIELGANASVPGWVKGTATVPYWWPPGDYVVVVVGVVVVYAYGFPLGPNNNTFWYLQNSTHVHLDPTGREPPAAPPEPLVGTSETFIPGAGPAAVLLALVGAVAARRHLSGRPRP